jgi:hypothetical protein
VTLVTVLLATPLAYIMSTIKIKGSSILQILILVSSMSAPFIGAYAWIMLCGRNGTITNFLMDTFGIKLFDIYGFNGCVIVMSLQLYSLVYMFVSGAFKNMDNSLIEACDREGMYVFDEAFDAWGIGKWAGDYSLYFNSQWEKDLTAFVKRDRTHPSVILWSIGNEIPERGGLGNGYTVATKLAETIHRLDGTRPVSNGICTLWAGLDDALGYAQESGIPYGIGFIKNKYIGRTFIVPGQNVREDKVKIKLNAVADTVKGKRVVLVDDSIVRGTTSARIVRLLRNAGATEVHFRSSAPPFINPCYYGTDIDSKESLIACHHTVEEIAKIMGADTLGYLPIEDVFKLCSEGTCKGLCAACFNGKYPTRIPKEKPYNKYDFKISQDKE